MEKRILFELRHRGADSMAHGDYVSAIDLYTMALEKETDDQRKRDIFYNRGLAYFYMGLQNLADSDFEVIRKVISSASDSSESESDEQSSMLTAPRTINEINLATEMIWSNKRSSKNYIERGRVFSHNGMQIAAINDYIAAAALDPRKPKVWIKLGNQGFKANRPDLIETAMKRLECLGYNSAIYEAENNIIQHLYEEALSLLNHPIMNDQENATLIAAHLYYLLGDVKNSLTLLLEEKEFGHLNDFDSLLLQILRLLNETDIPVQTDCSSPYNPYLQYLIQGIYNSLSLPLLKVPFDLLIPESIQLSWNKWSLSAEPWEPQQLSYPENFEKELHNIGNIYTLFHKSIKLGNILVRSSVNKREQVCLSLSLMQLVQMLQNPLLVDLDTAVATVSHWIRLYDPLAALFLRINTPFVLYLQRRGIKSDLSSYHTNVFKALKSKLVETADQEIKQYINSAETPEDLYRVILSDSCIKVGTNASLFLRMDPLRGIDMGIAIPYKINTFRSDYAKLGALWAKMMNLMTYRNNINSENYQQLSDFTQSMMRFLYDWMQLTPLSQCSHTIGHILFSSLLISYFGVEINKPVPMPLGLQIDALLAGNFEEFTTLIKERYPISFSQSTNITTLPSVITELPTYYHRIQALLLLDSTEFKNEDIFKTGTNINSAFNVESLIPPSQGRFDESIESV